MKFEFDHIGIASLDSQLMQDFLHDLVGLDFGSPEIVESQKVKVYFDESETVEIMEATQNESPIFKILEHPVLAYAKKHGNQVHHMAFRTTNIDAAYSYFKTKDVHFVGNQIYIGKGGAKVFFIRPKKIDTTFILEIIEREA